MVCGSVVLLTSRPSFFGGLLMKLDPDDIARIVEELRTVLVREIRQIVQKVLSERLGQRRLAVTGVLTANQRRVLKKINQLGDDEEAMRIAEGLLNNLIKVDRYLIGPFVQGLKLAFQQREWGVICPTCRKPAAPAWRADASCLTGGRMLYTHAGVTGKTVSHGSSVVLPHLKLTIKPDRRRRTNR
jgi:hypothetical protein